MSEDLPEFKSQHINKEPAIVTWPHISDRDIYGADRRIGLWRSLDRRSSLIDELQVSEQYLRNDAPRWRIPRVHTCMYPHTYKYACVHTNVPDIMHY